MRILRWWLAIVCSLSLSANVQAQSALTLTSWHIELWPEYDQSAVLVILAGTLPPTVILPAEVTLTIPGTATVFAAAVKDANDGLLNATFSTTPAGAQTQVKLTATASTFQLEYYDNNLAINNTTRSFTWQWQADYAAQQVTVRVQEPAGASQVRTTPALQTTGAGDLGLIYQEGNLGAVTAGQPLTLALSYTKSSSQLSVDAIGAARPAATPAPANPSAAGLLATPVTIVAILAAAVIVAALGWWGMRQRAATSRRRRGRSPRPPAKPRPPSPQAAPPGQQAVVPPPRAAPAPQRFCTQCGQPLQPGDRFCRACGAPISS